MNSTRISTLIALAILSASTGCAYRHYLGMHGPTIGNYPEIHTAAIREDSQCLSCHDPAASADAPPTTHPEFRGCLNCHNDPQP
jgi:predicted CXXCH cytochrome family protein